MRPPHDSDKGANSPHNLRCIYLTRSQGCGRHAVPTSQGVHHGRAAQEQHGRHDDVGHEAEDKENLTAEHVHSAK